MSLISLWKSNRVDIEAKKIQQLVAVAGEGSLRDGNNTSKELRGLLAVVPTELLHRYLAECLSLQFTGSGLVLQDIVNELGSRLDFIIVHGLYRGKAGAIGYDGIWLPNEGNGVRSCILTFDVILGTPYVIREL